LWLLFLAKLSIFIILAMAAISLAACSSLTLLNLAVPRTGYDLTRGTV
jgi:hypothetical protein